MWRNNLSRGELEIEKDQALVGTLEHEIESEEKRPLPNDIHIHDLKKQKLFLKDKIEDLSS